jgi:VWFA-related protein
MKQRNSMLLSKVARLQSVLFFSCIASALAQQPNSPTTTMRVTTQLTVVDVTVTDAKGNPVHNLTKADFTVKEDGKPQPIHDFNEYGTQVPPAQPAPPPLPPGIYTNQPSPAPTTSAVNILLFDSVNNGGSPFARPELFIYAKLQAAKYLQTMPAGTRVAILHSEEGLRLVQDVTTDRDVLLAAVSKLSYKSPSGTTVAVMAHTPFTAICAGWNRQSRLTLNALGQLAGFTFGIEGRKNVIWFMPGIPWLTNYDQWGGFFCLDNDTPQLHQAYNLLTAAQVALYPVDSRGLGGESTTNPAAAFLARANLHESLQSFAEATGGVPYFNRNDLDTVIGEAISAGSDYYLLSYVPPLAGYDGKYHTIDVKVDRPGLRLQYRKNYTSLDPAKLFKPSTEPTGKTAATDLPPAVTQFRAGMAHGALPSAQLLLAARVLPSTTALKPAPLPVKGDLNPKLNNKPLIRYDIVYSIPAGQITVADNPDGTHTASVEFDIVAYAEDGTKLNVLRQPIKVTLTPDRIAQFQQKPFDLPLQLDLPPGKLFLRIGALDIPSGKIGTLEIPETVAKP